MYALFVFLATTAVLATDPPVFLVALLVGALSRSRRAFLIGVAVFAPALHLVISFVIWRTRVGYGRPGTFTDVLLGNAAPRLAAFLTIALVAAGLARLWRDRHRQRKIAGR